MMRFARCSLCFFALSINALMSQVSAEELTQQQSALRFAGLLESTQDASSKSFQNQATAAWSNYEKQVGQPLLTWAKKEVAYSGGGTVFYPFSGPDFLTVARMFPNADRYVMVAIQKARKPATPEKMPTLQRHDFEKRFAVDWTRFGKLGFFRTLDLDDDQLNSQSGVGVTSILMAFSARLGYQVLAVTPLAFNTEKGEWEPRTSDEKWDSVRLYLQKNGGTITTLDYLRIDLSDQGLSASEPIQAWIQRMSAKPTLLKAASHLLQKKSFSILRDFLANNSAMVVQDETGLDYNYLTKIGNVRLYGNFSQTHFLFTSTTQRALALAYKGEKSPGELPFAFSYLKKSGLRSIQIARRQAAK
jgi:hypothetical protein